MGDYVASMRVSLDNQVSQNAAQAAQSLGLVADAADRASQSTKTFGSTITEGAPALGTFNEKLVSLSDVTSAISTINQKFQDGLSALRKEVDAGTTSTEAAAQKETQLTTQRDAQTQAARKQAQAVSDGLNVQTDATTKASQSSAELADSHDKLAEQELALYSAIAGGKGTLTAMIENMAKSAAASGSAAGSTGALGGAFSALISPTGLAVTALVGFGVVAYEVFKRSSDLAEQQRALTTSITATGRAAQISVGQLQQYAEQLKTAGVSSGDANTIANNIARTQGLNPSQSAQVVSLTPNASVALNMSDVEAAKLLTQAAQGSADAINQIDRALNILSPDEAANVQVMLDHGDKTKALTLVFDKLHERIDTLRQDSLSPTDQAFKDMKNGWSDFIDAVASSGPVMDQVKGWGYIFQSLAGYIKPSQGDISTQIVDLTNQAITLQKQIDATATTTDSTLGKVTSWVKSDLSSIGVNLGGASKESLQAQLQVINDKISALIDKSRKLAEAVPVDTSNPLLGGLTVDTTVQDQKDLFTKAQSRVGSSTAGQIAALTAENQKYNDALAQMGARTDENANRFDAFTAAIKANDDAMAALNKKTTEHVSELSKQQDTLDAQIEEQESLIIAYSQGTDAVQKVIATEEAKKQVVHDNIKDAGEYAAAVDDLTNKHLRLIQVKAQADNTKEITELKQATEAQLKVNAAYDGTTASITHAESAQKAYLDTVAKGVSTKSPGFADEVNKLADAYDKSKAATAAFAQQQASVNALAGIATNAFDSLGNSMVQAFVSGQGGAINFGNILKGILASVLEGLAKLALLNPILNSIGVGTVQPTLLSALGVLANGSGIQTGGLAGLSNVPGNSSSSGILGNISTLYSAGKELFTSGSGGVSSAINAYATAHLPGLFATPADTAITQASLMAGEPVALTGAGTGATIPGYLPFTASQALGAIGGVTAGYGVGSLAGGLEQSALGKTGPGPQIGAGIGAAGLVAAAALAPETFGLSLIAAGLIGGTAGGLAGGLIGPKPQSSYSSTGLDTSNGVFSVGSSVYQQDSNAGAEIADTNQKVTALNAILTSHSLSVNSGHIQIGDNNPGGGYQDPGKYASVDSALAAGVYHFQSSDPTLSNVLSKKTDNFQSVAEFQTWISNFDAAQASAKNFILNTTNLLKNFGNVNGSLNDSLDGIVQQFTDAKTAADALKTSGYLSDQQISDLSTAETNLASARDKATAAAYAAANQQTQSLNQNFTNRFNIANAANSNNPAQQEAAALSVFDASAKQQKDELTQQLTALYGTAYLSTAGYANELIFLENALGAERLGIVQTYNQQIAANDNATKLAAQQSALATQQAAQQAAAAAAATKLAAQQAADALSSTARGLIDNLTSYTRNLRTSQLSPLSPLNQYALNSNTFTKDAALAAGGDAGAIGRITSESDAFLNSSRSVNGSGSQYAADFQQVLDALSQISEVQPDTLTASIAAAQSATQTQTLVASLAELKAELVAIRTQLASNASTPGRIAA